MSSRRYRLPRGFKKASAEQRARLIFDHVKKHLLTQRERAVASGKYPKQEVRCVYRNAEGKACAVGCLMADYLNPSQCGGSVRGVILDFMLFPRTRQWALMMRPHRYLLAELQRIHDLNPVDTWERHLQELERDLGNPEYFNPEGHDD